MHSRGHESDIYFEFTPGPGDRDAVAPNLRAVAGVIAVEETPSLNRIYGKRIIVMGGGAQVGQVALGAIAEADRHNIRGERISVDTIPLVGEAELAAAVRAVVRLPRAPAGARRFRWEGRSRARWGCPRQWSVCHLADMAGSVPEAADLV